jgi:HSP20 family protein
MNVIAQLLGRRTLRSLEHRRYPIAGGSSRGLDLIWIPTLDYSESEEAYRVQMKMPGLKAEDIRLFGSPQGLSIHAWKRHGAGTSEDTLLDRSLIRAFERQVPLNDNVARDDIQAGYDGGVLTLILPKSEPKPPQTVSTRP